MSYILDALKKSEQQRQHGVTPTLQVAQVTVATPKRPAAFYYGLLAVVLLAGILIGLLRPWQAEQLPAETDSMAVELHAQSPQAATISTITAPLNVDKETPQIPTPSDQQSADIKSAANQDLQVVLIDELPLAIQREIPSMAIQLHAYSSIPGERLVSINSIRLREGGSLMLGLRLEQITPDGMIFSYKGYRFRHGIR